MGRRKEDQSKCGDLRQAYTSGSPIFRQDGNVRLAWKLHYVQSIAGTKRGVCEADVDGSFRQGIQLLICRHFEEPGLNIWMHLPQTRQASGQMLVKGRGDKTDPDFARSAVFR